eukprot:gb/GECG01013156.1/.p1 GENE.gb/GECG01013156.1/~~gb/GECG01013156.1/.p1  ORF type:complete len:2683 (+),score=414.97 gb/GECG01013156.1/:1-8049(+)
MYPKLRRGRSYKSSNFLTGSPSSEKTSGGLATTAPGNVSFYSVGGTEEVVDKTDVSPSETSPILAESPARKNGQGDATAASPFRGTLSEVRPSNSNIRTTNEASQQRLRKNGSSYTSQPSDSKSKEPVDVNQFFEDELTSLSSLQGYASSTLQDQGGSKSTTDNEEQSEQQQDLGKRLAKVRHINTKEPTESNKLSVKNNIKYTMPEEKVDRLLTLSNKALNMIDVQSEVPRTTRRRSSFSFEETQVDDSIQEADDAYKVKAQHASVKSARAKVALRILEYVFEKLHDYSGVLRLVSEALQCALYRDEEQALDVSEPRTISIPECYSARENNEEKAKLYNSEITRVIATAVTRLSDRDPDEGLESEVEFQRRWTSELQSLLEEEEVATSEAPTLGAGSLTGPSMVDMRMDNSTYCSEGPRLALVNYKFSLLNNRLSEENSRLQVMSSRVEGIMRKITNRWKRTILVQTFRTWRENAAKYRVQLRKIHSILLRASLSRLKRVSFQEWSRYVKRKRWQRIEEEANKLMQSVTHLTQERDRMCEHVGELENARKEALKRRQDLQQSISELSEDLKTKKEKLNDNTEYHLRSSTRAWIRFADASFEAQVKSCSVTLETLSGPLPECAPVHGINEHCSLAVSDSASNSMGFGDFGRTKPSENQDDQQMGPYAEDLASEEAPEDRRRRSKAGTDQDPTMYQEAPEIKGFRLDIGNDQGFEKQYVVNPVLLLTPQEIAAAKAATSKDDHGERLPLDTVAQQSSLPELPPFEQECLRTLASLPFDVLLLRWVNFHTHNGNVGLWRDWWRLWYREVTAPKANASVGVRDLRKKVKKHARRSTKVPRRRSVLARRVSQASSGGGSMPEQSRSRTQSSASSMSGKSRSVAQSGVDYNEASPAVFKALVEATVPFPAEDAILMSSSSYGHVRFGEVVDSAIERRSSYNVRSSRKPMERLELSNGMIQLDPSFTFTEQQSASDASQLLDMHIWCYGLLNSIPRDSWKLLPLRRKIEKAAGVVQEEEANTAKTGAEVADSAVEDHSSAEKELNEQIKEESEWRGSVMQIENFGNSLSGGDAYALLLHRVSVSNSFSMTQLSTCRELLYPVDNLSREGSYNPASVEWQFSPKEKRSKSRQRRSSAGYASTKGREASSDKGALTAVAKDSSYLVYVDRDRIRVQLQVPSVFPTCSRPSRAGSSSASQKTDFENIMRDTRKSQRSNACLVPFPTALPQFPPVLSQVDDTGRAREIIEYLIRIGCPKGLLKKEHVMQSEKFTMRNLIAVAFIMSRWPELRCPDGWCTFPRDSSEDHRQTSMPGEESTQGTESNFSSTDDDNKKSSIHTRIFSGKSVDPLLPFHVIADHDWDFEEEKRKLLNRMDNLMAVGDDTMLAHPCTLKRVMEILTRLRLEWRSYVTAVMMISSPTDRADETLSINPDDEDIPKLSKLAEGEEFHSDFLERAHNLAENWRSAARIDTIDHPWYDPQLRKNVMDSRPVTLAAVALQHVRDVADEAVTVRRLRSSMWTRLREHIQSASWSLVRSLTQSASHGPHSIPKDPPKSGLEETNKTPFTDEEDGLTIIDRGAVRVYHAYAIAPLSMLNPIAPVYLFVSDPEWLPADVTAPTIQQATRLTLDYTQQRQVVSKVMSQDPDLVMRTLKEQSIFEASGLPDDPQNVRDFAKGATRAIISLISIISDQLQNWHKLTQQVFLHYAATAEGDADTMDWKEFLGFAKECRIMRRDEEEEKIRESLRKKKQKGPVGPIRQGGGAGMGKFSVLVSTGGKSTLVQRPSSADDYSKVPKSGLTRRELRSCFIESVADEKKRDQLRAQESDSDPFWEPDAELGQSEFVSLVVRTAVKYFRRERIAERAQSRIEEERKKRDKARESTQHAPQAGNVQAGGLAIAAKLREGKMTPDDFLKLKRERPDLFNAVRRGDYGIDLKLTADGMMQQLQQKNKQQAKASKERQQASDHEQDPKQSNDGSTKPSQASDTDDFKSAVKTSPVGSSSHGEDSSADVPSAKRSQPPPSDKLAANTATEGPSSISKDSSVSEGATGDTTSHREEFTEHSQHHVADEHELDTHDIRTSETADSHHSDTHSIGEFSTKRDRERDVAFSFTPESSRGSRLSTGENEQEIAEVRVEEEPVKDKDASGKEGTNGDEMEQAEEQDLPEEHSPEDPEQTDKRRVTFQEPVEAQKPRRASMVSEDAPDPFQTTDAYEHDFNGDKVQFGKFHYYTEDSVTNHVHENIRQVAAVDHPKRNLMVLTIHPSVAYEAFMNWFVLRYACRSQQSDWNQELKKPAMRAVYRKYHDRLTNMFSAYIHKRAYRLKKTLKRNRPNEISPEEVDSVVAAGAGAMTINDVCDLLRMSGLLLSKKKKKQAEKARDRTTVTGAISESSMKHCMLFDIRGAVSQCGMLKGLDLLTAIMKVVDSNRLIASGEYVYNVDVELLYDSRKIFRLKRFRKLLLREGITRVEGIRLFQFVPTLMRVDKDLAHAVLAPSELPLWRLARSHRSSYYYLVREEDTEHPKKEKGEVGGELENEKSDQEDWDDVFNVDDSEDDDDQSEEDKAKEAKTKEPGKRKGKKGKAESEQIPPPPSIGLDEELQYGELMELLPALAVLYDPRPHVTTEKKFNLFISKFIPEELRAKKGKLKRQPSSKRMDAAPESSPPETVDEKEETADSLEETAIDEPPMQDDNYSLSA